MIILIGVRAQRPQWIAFRLHYTLSLACPLTAETTPQPGIRWLTFAISRGALTTCPANRAVLAAYLLTPVQCDQFDLTAIPPALQPSQLR